MTQICRPLAVWSDASHIDAPPVQRREAAAGTANFGTAAVGSRTGAACADGRGKAKDQQPPGVGGGGGGGGDDEMIHGTRGNPGRHTDLMEKSDAAIVPGPADYNLPDFLQEGVLNSHRRQNGVLHHGETSKRFVATDEQRSPGPKYHVSVPWVSTLTNKVVIRHNPVTQKTVTVPVPQLGLPAFRSVRKRFEGKHDDKGPGYYSELECYLASRKPVNLSSVSFRSGIQRFDDPWTRHQNVNVGPGTYKATVDYPRRPDSWVTEVLPRLGRLRAPSPPAILSALDMPPGRVIEACKAPTQKFRGRRGKVAKSDGSAVAGKTTGASRAAAVGGRHPPGVHDDRAGEAGSARRNDPGSYLGDSTIRRKAGEKGPAGYSAAAKVEKAAANPFAKCFLMTPPSSRGPQAIAGDGK